MDIGTRIEKVEGNLFPGLVAIYYTFFGSSCVDDGEGAVSRAGVGDFEDGAGRGGVAALGLRDAIV